MRRLLTAAALALLALALAALLALADVARGQTPCGVTQTPDAGALPWFSEDGFGNPRPCPPDPGTLPTPVPEPPPPPPDWPPRSILNPINP